MGRRMARRLGPRRELGLAWRRHRPRRRRRPRIGLVRTGCGSRCPLGMGIWLWLALSLLPAAVPGAGILPSDAVLSAAGLRPAAATRIGLPTAHAPPSRSRLCARGPHVLGFAGAGQCPVLIEVGAIGANGSCARNAAAAMSALS